MSADELRDELDRLREIVREQSETIKDQNERINELEDENEENAEKEAQDLIEIRTDDDDDSLTLRDVWIAGLPFGKIVDQIETKIDGPGRIKDRLANLESRSVQNGETGNAKEDDQEEGASPLAQLIDLPAKKAEEVLTENQARARLVAQRARELGTDTKAGLVVKSADIAEHLHKHEESAHSETISRVMDFIADLGKDDVTAKMHKGKRLLVFDPTRVKEYGRGGEPAVVRSRRDVIYARESGPDLAPA
jgi:hypothetical protein